MNFIKGLFIGSLVGFSIGSALSEHQRSELAARVRRRTTIDALTANRQNGTSKQNGAKPVPVPT